MVWQVEKQSTNGTITRINKINKYSKIFEYNQKYNQKIWIIQKNIWIIWLFYINIQIC